MRTIYKMLVLPHLQTQTFFKSPINYNGNKFKLLSQIEPLFPKSIDSFVDVFGGSGTVLFNTKAKAYIYNDINPFVCSIVQGLLAESYDSIVHAIDNLISKYQLSKTNKEGFKKLKDDYNNGQKDWITLYTLMCHSFNHQFRFNSDFQYNSSFGSIRAYFSEAQRDSLKALKQKDFTHICVLNKSFDSIDYKSFNSNDFIYFDPPYLGSTGNYNDGKRGFEGWTLEHEKTLWSICEQLTSNNIKFALSNNLVYDNPILQSCINKYKVHHIGNVQYSNYQKQSSASDEVLITNY